MHFVTVLLLFTLSLNADSVYDFWDSSQNTNKRNSVNIRDVDTSNIEYLRQNDTIQPNNIAKDLNEENTKLTPDAIKPQTKDRYLRYNKRDANEPTIAKDLDPKKVNISPDFIDEYNKQQQYKNSPKQIIKTNTNKYSLVKQKNPKEKEEFLNNNVVVFQESNNREDSFIDIIPYLTIGNSLFVITNGEYDARVLDDSISASMSIDLGLNYIWENRNVGYLWNINFGDYDFSEKDRSHLDSQSSGEVTGLVISVMPTVFYELNRAQSMSVLIGYGAGFSYIKLDGSAILANGDNQTIEDTITIDNFYFSHGLMLEVLHNNFMISFTKVNITVEESNQNIQINENRLNLGYKFSF